MVNGYESMFQHSGDSQTHGKKLRRQKPPIWSDGRQAPKFDLVSFLRASTIRSRDLAARTLAMSAGGVRRAAASFRDGTWRLSPERLGHTGRWLPDHRTMARSLTAAARLATAAGEWAAGDRAADLAPPDAWNAAAANEPVPPPAPSPLRYVRPRRGAAAVPSVEVDQETLSAIRTVVHAANVMPVRLLRVPGVGPEPGPPPPESRAARLPELQPAEPLPPGRMYRAATAALGAAAMAALWPAGAFQAFLAHLRGEDLRDLA